jgi:hypothetical protein
MVQWANWFDWFAARKDGVLAFAALISPLITGGFTLLGVRLGQRGAAAAVKQTFEGQRTLARDAALRDYRKQQTAPYLEAARQRIRIWTEMHAEVGVDERAMLELQAKTTDAYFNSLVVTYLEISDDSFRAAFQRFVDAEGKFKSAYAEGEVMDKIKQMRLALDELSKASEHYIFLS